MFAGSGSTFEQMFGISPMVGSIIMVVLTILTLLLDTNKIISIIAAVTPYLIAVILIIVAYSIFTMDISLTTADAIAKEQTSASSNWLLSAFYMSHIIFQLVLPYSLLWQDKLKTKKSLALEAL